MRTAFTETLTELAANDPSVILMSGDLGFGVLNEFREQLGDQFINVGVAEQNLAGIAAGLALSGHKVVTYSIGNFPTLRCLEQLRNDVCYHDADVMVVTVGGGMAYGALGPSHFATEDIGIMRMLPYMKVVAPGDAHEVRQLIPQLVGNGPAYLRLGRDGEPEIHDQSTVVTLGQPSLVRDGEDLCLLVTGGLLSEVLIAADRLCNKDGINARVVSVHTPSPLTEDGLRSAIGECPMVITCEEHSRHGGLGGIVAEFLAEQNNAPRLRRFGLNGTFPDGIGSQEYLRSVNCLDAAALVELVRRDFRRTC